MRRWLLTSALLLGASALVGCTELEQAADAVDWFSYMRDSPSFDPYEAPRPSPPGAVPFESPHGDAIHAVGNSQRELLELAGRATPPAMDSTDLPRGQEMYTRHCAVCHGPTGQGNGPVVGPPPGKFPMGPNLMLPNVLAYDDGYIYAVIRQGRGLMPAYGHRMSERERWQVVYYVRQLQQSGAGGAAAPGGTQAADTAAVDTAAAGDADTTDSGS